jgi:hypothetical protein
VGVKGLKTGELPPLDVRMEPLQPLQLRADLVGEACWRLVRGRRVRQWWLEGLGHVRHDGDPHRQVESVEHVLGLGVEVTRQVADVFAAVGGEGDLLVGGHPLGIEHFTSNQPSVRDRC